MAVDIDPEAVRVTQENLELNEVERLVAASTTDLGDLQDEYGIVVANILAEELVRLSEQLKARLAPAGWLILSGILTEKAEFVCGAFTDLTLVEHTRDAEWSCLTFRKG